MGTYIKNFGGDEIMKKRIEDLTLHELAELCQRQQDCANCPFVELCQLPPTYIYIKKQEEKEIELL